jgi:peroxiredoxin
MTVRRQLAVLLAVMAGLALAALIFIRWNRDELFLVSPGSPAPSFTAHTIDAASHPRGLDEYRGQVVLLNVWATWCQPCVVEMPSIERLYRDYEKAGLKVVAVSVDTPGVSDSVVRAFAARFGLTFDVLRDSTGAIEKKYQTTGYPETFVIGRDGVIRKKVIGASDWDSPGDRSLIAQLLREPAS